MTTERKRLIANAQGYPGRSMEEVWLAGGLSMRALEAETEVEHLKKELEVKSASNV